VKVGSELHGPVIVPKSTKPNTDCTRYDINSHCATDGDVIDGSMVNGVLNTWLLPNETTVIHGDHARTGFAAQKHRPSRLVCAIRCWNVAIIEPIPGVMPRAMY